MTLPDTWWYRRHNNTEDMTAQTSWRHRRRTEPAEDRVPARVTMTGDNIRHEHGTHTTSGAHRRVENTVPRGERLSWHPLEQATPVNTALSEWGIAIIMDAHDTIAKTVIWTTVLWTKHYARFNNFVRKCKRRKRLFHSLSKQLKLRQHKQRGRVDKNAESKHRRNVQTGSNTTHNSAS